jgi:transcriptional regulator with XRE-family HTH domain
MSGCFFKQRAVLRPKPVDIPASSSNLLEEERNGEATGLARTMTPEPTEPMEFDPTFNIDGDKLRKLREKNKVTQLYLATVVGVTTETISRWENRRYPTIKKENALKLAEALQVSLDELVESQIEGQMPSEDAGGETPTPDQPAAIPLPEAKSGWPRPSRRHPLILLPLLLGMSFLAWQFFFKAQSPGFTATRHLPDHVLSGQVFPVLIEVIADESKSATLMLRESLPEQCLPLAATPPFIGQNEEVHLIKWIGKVEASGRNHFAYLAKVNEKAQPGKRLFFAGSLIIGKQGDDEPKVAGDQETEVTLFHWADKNRDNRIDDYELLSVYELFPNFRELGLDLTEIEKIWASRKYHWNNETKIIETNGK